MRINDSSLNGLDRVQDKKDTVKPQAVTVAAGEKATTVSVSAAATNASQTAQARAEKVQQIAKAMQGGTYKVDLDKLSHAIASDELARAA
jgi:anti-sigma28 factor (negative regulator of flagellin synthesis)